MIEELRGRTISLLAVGPAGRAPGAAADARRLLEREASHAVDARLRQTGRREQRIHETITWGSAIASRSGARMNREHCFRPGGDVLETPSACFSIDPEQPLLVRPFRSASRRLARLVCRLRLLLEVLLEVLPWIERLRFSAGFAALKTRARKSFSSHTAGTIVVSAAALHGPAAPSPPAEQQRTERAAQQKHANTSGSLPPLSPILAAKRPSSCPSSSAMTPAPSPSATKAPSRTRARRASLPVTGANEPARRRLSVLLQVPLAQRVEPLERRSRAADPSSLRRGLRRTCCAGCGPGCTWSGASSAAGPPPRRTRRRGGPRLPARPPPPTPPPLRAAARSARRRVMNRAQAPRAGMYRAPPRTSPAQPHEQVPAYGSETRRSRDRSPRSGCRPNSSARCSMFVEPFSRLFHFALGPSSRAASRLASSLLHRSRSSFSSASTSSPSDWPVLARFWSSSGEAPDEKPSPCARGRVGVVSVISTSAEDGTTGLNVSCVSKRAKRRTSKARGRARTRTRASATKDEERGETWCVPELQRASVRVVIFRLCETECDAASRDCSVMVAAFSRTRRDVFRQTLFSRARHN